MSARVGWVLLVAMGVLALSALGGSRAVENPPMDVDRIGVADLGKRLAALNESDPEGYFLLGELVAAEAPVNAEARGLARQLLTLAHELDRRQGGRTGLRSSACLALASITVRPDEQRLLLALARMQAPPGTSTPMLGVKRTLLQRASEQTILDVCSALGYARAGDGRRATLALSNPGARELFESLDAALNEGGSSVGRIERAMADWPQCPDCRNKRTVSRVEGKGAPRVRLCPTCAGVPGPNWNDSEYIAQLRVESALLSGTHRSWSAQALADAGAPLRDPEPASLGALMRVDTRATRWRNGAWVVP